MDQNPCPSFLNNIKYLFIFASTNLLLTLPLEKAQSLLMNSVAPISFSSSSFSSPKIVTLITPSTARASFCLSCKLPLTPVTIQNKFLKFKSTPINPFSIVSPIFRTFSKFSTRFGCYLQDRGVDTVAGYEDSDVLQNGGLGLALLSVTSTAKVRISPFLSTLAANPTFLSGVLAWFFAQSIKVVLNFFVERKWDLRILFASGGMPSSHSALCTALTTSVAICHGAADSLFPVCLGFSLIVMYDAIGVRRHAGMQAEGHTLLAQL